MPIALTCLFVRAGERFEKPEDAALAFVKCIRTGDLAGALPLFAYENKAKHIDFVALTKRMSSLVPFTPLGPAIDEGYIELSIALEKGTVARQLRFFLYSFLLPDEFKEYMNMRPQAYKGGEEEAEQAAKRFIQALDMGRMSDFTLVEMELASPELQNADRHRDYLQRQMAIYGFEEHKDYLVMYKWDGEYYIGGMMLMKYDGSWQIDSLTSNLGGIGTLGKMVEKVD